MDGAWADRLERRFGLLAIPDLPSFLTGMTVVVGVLALIKPEFLGVLILEPELVRGGQLWRLLTFLAIPPVLPRDLFSILWLALWAWFLHSCLKTLELAWSEFKLTIYLGLGAFAAAAASLWSGEPTGNGMPILACFLALTRVDPERIVLIYFVPVKMRWLANLAWLWLGLQLITGHAYQRALVLSLLAPYLSYFGESHRRELEEAWRRRKGPR
ncbi:MAG TPA: hypothetical protein DCZ01_10900 [Elusimicrobia bacterium]|nr:MAG: hypothetical protein A2X37_01900 [Elusimicrobia bacterium GWA2_66_18]OGR73070.1 MAG: hypothetical protein A2X40_11880 [Elusimicrobia bacterium GWC2_65_9]HAZ09000.1 hypothetical protein [Elusimicrobiota bacterium]